MKNTEILTGPVIPTGPARATGCHPWPRVPSSELCNWHS